MKRVVCVGLGAIGEAMFRECMTAPDFHVVGAVDPAKAGERVDDVTVHRSLEEAIREVGADVALVATSSILRELVSHIAPLVSRGIHVISTCEDLAFPWLADEEAAASLNRLARENRVSIVGAGVNPGFVMDLLPALAATASLTVEGIIVRRSVRLDDRRDQLRRKLGIGMREADWHDAAMSAALGHRGLTASAYLCALAVGWNVKGSEFQRTPVVDRGLVCGVTEKTRVRCEENCTLELELDFRLGGEGVDTVQLVRREADEMRLEIGGLQGDEATVARALHAARVVHALQPGVRLPIEVPVWTGDPVQVDSGPVVTSL